MLGLAACQSIPTPAPAAPAPSHEGTNAILWLQTAAEYHAATLQAFRSATLHLERALADPTWSAAPEQQGDFGTLPPAIILDMDEAIIRSDRFQAGLVKNDTHYSLSAELPGGHHEEEEITRAVGGLGEHHPRQLGAFTASRGTVDSPHQLGRDLGPVRAQTLASALVVQYTERSSKRRSSWPK